MRKQTAVLGAVCEANASHDTAQTDDTCPLPSATACRTEKQLGFLFRNPLALMFFQIINITFHSLCCLQRAGLETCVERTPNVAAVPAGTAHAPADEPQLSSTSCHGQTLAHPALAGLHQAETLCPLPKGALPLGFLLGTLTCVTQQVEFGPEPLPTNVSVSNLSDHSLL